MRDKVTKTDEEWRPHSAGHPFTGAWRDQHDGGAYRCICCGR